MKSNIHREQLSNGTTVDRSLGLNCDFCVKGTRETREEERGPFAKGFSVSLVLEKEITLSLEQRKPPSLYFFRSDILLIFGP
jgi:hypothetical protein